MTQEMIMAIACRGSELALQAQVSVRLDFPFPPGTARPGTGADPGAHRSGPRPSYLPPVPSRRGPGR
jgi:hypothetical protein